MSMATFTVFSAAGRPRGGTNGRAGRPQSPPGAASRAGSARPARAPGLGWTRWVRRRRGGPAPRASLARRQVVEGNGVLVHGDAGFLETSLGVAAHDAALVDVHQQQVRVGPARDDAEASARNRLRQLTGVGPNLLLIGLELRLHRFLQAERLGGNAVHRRPALVARKNDLVQLLGILLAAENHPAALPAARRV